MRFGVLADTGMAERDIFCASGRATIELENREASGDWSSAGTRIMVWIAWIVSSSTVTNSA
jgi:hypothetical protein